MKTSSSLRIKHGMISILLSCFLLRYFSSRALTTGVRLRVCVRANRVHICIPASWDTEEAYVGFSATGGARPHINLRFPTCYDARDAVGTCGELTVSCTHIVVTYKIPPARSTRQQVSPLSVALFTTFYSRSERPSRWHRAATQWRFST